MKGIKPIALWLVALMTVAITLLYVESDFLWKVQQNNLFLYSSLFFKQQMAVPGGMISYLGSFFTQYFYVVWVGVAMLCGWWLLLMWLIKCTFCVSDRWSIITLIPIAILLVANMDLGYWIYVMRLPGYFFSPTIGTTVGVALLWTYRKLPGEIWTHVGYTAFVVLAGYPLIGVYALVSALLMAVWTCRFSKKRQQNLVFVLAVLLMVVAIPLVYYRFVYHQTNIADIYRMALPEFPFDEDYLRHLIPYYLLAVCFLAFSIVRFQYNPRSILHWVLQGVLLTAMIAGGWHFWYKDENFHHELRMQRCIEHTDWEGVVEEGRKQVDEPTRAIVMMRNLALSRLGRQCDEMYNFRNGAKRSNSTLPMQTFYIVGRLINYQYGLMNECHRFCMEDGIGIGWSVELLQYMARAAIMSNEPQLARNYLNLLRQTHYYGDWTDHMECLIDNPDLIKSDKETGPITHMMQYEDTQSEGDGNVEKNLMTMLSKVDSNDPYFQEQAVLAAMWTKNISDFWLRFDRYVKLYEDIYIDHIPRIIQEAVYLFGNLQQLPFVNELSFSQEVTDSFEGFMTQMQKCQGKPDSWMKDYLYQNYGNTYYYEFFFQRDLTYD